MDRVELPPGVSVEGGPDGGGAGGAIHKTHEVMRPPPVNRNYFHFCSEGEGEEDDEGRRRACVCTTATNTQQRQEVES